jgi:hypothetical protein
MAKGKKSSQPNEYDIAMNNFNEGCFMVQRHPLFKFMDTDIVRSENVPYPQDGLAYVSADG